MNVRGLNCEVDLSKLSKSQLKPLTGGLNNLFLKIKSKREDFKIRLYVFRKVRKVIQDVDQNCTVNYYGSLSTNLFMGTSDLDIAVKPSRKDTSSFFECVKQSLEGRYEVKNMKLLHRGRHFSFEFVDFGIKVDLSLQEADTFRSGQKKLKGIVNSFKQRFRNYYKLMMLCKQFLRSHDINSPSRGQLGSYCLMLLVNSFLTLNFHLECEPLGRLVLEFMRFFQKFDHQNNYIKADGTHAPKKENARMFADQGKAHVLVIEDPLDKNNDVGKPAYDYFNVRKSICDVYARVVERLLAGKCKGNEIADVFAKLNADDGRKVKETRERWLNWTHGEWAPGRVFIARKASRLPATTHEARANWPALNEPAAPCVTSEEDFPPLSGLSVSVEGRGSTAKKPPPPPPPPPPQHDGGMQSVVASASLKNTKKEQEQKRKHERHSKRF